MIVCCLRVALLASVAYTALIPYPDGARLGDVERGVNRELLTRFRHSVRLIFDQVAAETRHGHIMRRIEARIRGYDRITEEVNRLHADISECQAEIEGCVEGCRTCLLATCPALQPAAACLAGMLLHLTREGDDLRPEWMATMDKISVYNFTEDLQLQDTIPFINKVHAIVNNQTRLILRTMMELSQDVDTLLTSSDYADQFNTSSLHIQQFFNDLRLLTTPEQMNSLEASMRYTDNMIEEVHSLVRAMEDERVRVEAGHPVGGVQYPQPRRQRKTFFDVLADTVEGAVDATLGLGKQVACGVAGVFKRGACGGGGRARRATECNHFSDTLFHSQISTCGIPNCQECDTLLKSGVECTATLEADLAAYHDTVRELLQSELSVKQQNDVDEQALEDNLQQTVRVFDQHLWVSPFSNALRRDKVSPVEVRAIHFDPNNVKSQLGELRYEGVIADVAIDHLGKSETVTQLPLRPVNVHNASAVGQEVANRFLAWYQAEPRVKALRAHIMHLE